MLSDKNIFSRIKELFPYKPTDDQETVIGKLAKFLFANEPGALFLLKGYAGTGKTTIVSSLVKMLPEINARAVLLAPTGRAAKVLSGYAGSPAYTIHKNIYRMQASAEGSIMLKLQKNKHANTVFIVDEASMIPWETASQPGLFSGTNLLDDLIEFVYSGENCCMVFIGDSAQLPPVMANESPALNKAFLEKRYGLQIIEYELREVVRQAFDSGILHNATLVRNMLHAEQLACPKMRLDGFSDVIRVQGQEAADEVENAYLDHGREHALMICRSNKRANMYNKHIRQRVLFMEEEINAGDLLMVVKNNYFWLPEDSEAGFIANGDIVELKRIIRHEEMYGFRFADVTLRLTDYPDLPDLDAKLLLDTLDSDGPSLSAADYKRLFESVAEDYQNIPNKRTRVSAIRRNPWLNALQVKYAYAMTCHKAQGGQWKHVFVEMGYLRDKTPDKEYLRWLYTAMTRATKKLFFLNFTDDFFSRSSP
ncbi:MAG: DUF2075 domain-containing protein [Bacteroidia bacterium]|nr:MAG: DUF2075 domain-containing protein [Bacteroidia bacterium]